MNLVNQIVVGNIMDASFLERSACLAILNLPCSNLRSIFGDINNDEDCLKTARSIIQKSYEMTAVDGICCVIGADDRDMDTDTTNMAGTKVAQDVHPWHVCDEIIWHKTVPHTDSADSDPAVIDFEETPFSQIWVLSKQESRHNATPDRSEMLADAGLPSHMIDEIADSVWYVPARSRRPYKDPLPLELLIRLVLSYSKPGSLVLDPFAWHGATALVCRHFQRDFVCLTNSNDNLEMCKRRLCKDKEEEWANGYT